MRWFVILLLAVVLAGFAVYTNLERPAIRIPAATTTPASVNGIGELMEGYTNKDLGFSMESPARAQSVHENFEGFLPVTASPVIAFTIPKDLFEGTNLSEAGVYVGATSSPGLVEQCRRSIPMQGEKNAGSEMIGENPFYVFTATDAAAGNLYDFKIRRGAHMLGKVRWCFEIVELLHSGNIGNYPEGTVVQFDKAKFTAILESIAKSFTFTK